MSDCVNITVTTANAGFKPPQDMFNGALPWVKTLTTISRLWSPDFAAYTVRTRCSPRMGGDLT